MAKHNGAPAIQDPVTQRLLRDVAQQEQRAVRAEQAYQSAIGRVEFLQCILASLLARIERPEDLETPRVVVTKAEIEEAGKAALHITPNTGDEGGHRIWLCVTPEEIGAAQAREARRQAAEAGAAKATPRLVSE